MLLNGWKEIAAYLKCSVRTAQRWQRDVHMPVMKVRDSERGPVMADSEALERWMKHHSVQLKQDEQASAFTTLKEQARQGGYNFLWTELATGRNFAELVKAAMNDEVAARRRKAARKAYDSIQRHLSFTKALPKAELNRFNTELREFKSELQKLGEVF